jgi:predicted GIY-YIG superfamily endonuclease
MIYFVQCEMDGPIKIGFTDNVNRRMSALRSSNSEMLILLGVMEGDRALEKEIQKLFEKKQGEWFYPTPALYEYIRLNCDENLRPLRG